MVAKCSWLLVCANSMGTDLVGIAPDYVAFVSKWMRSLYCLVSLLDSWTYHPLLVLHSHKLVCERIFHTFKSFPKLKQFRCRVFSGYHSFLCLATLTARACMLNDEFFYPHVLKVRAEGYLHPCCLTPSSLSDYSMGPRFLDRSTGFLAFLVAFSIVLAFPILLTYRTS